MAENQTIDWTYRYVNENAGKKGMDPDRQEIFKTRYEGQDVEVLVRVGSHPTCPLLQDDLVVRFYYGKGNREFMGLGNRVKGLIEETTLIKSLESGGQTSTRWRPADLIEFVRSRRPIFESQRYLRDTYGILL